MSTRKLLEAFAAWSREQADLVLVTVVATEGSTYSKPGHRILIGPDGRYQGLVSGGCLEGDLVAQAETVLAENTATCLSYDLRADVDGVFGLGVGCDGMLGLLLQPLRAAAAYEPFGSLANVMHSNTTANSVVVVASENARWPLGATAVIDQDSVSAGDNELSALAASAVSQFAGAETALVSLEPEEGEVTVLCSPLWPVPRLLVLGAGPDAVPLVNMAIEAGWQVTLADHREAYLNAPELSRADRHIEAAPESISAAVPLQDFHAVIAMSHNLEADRLYLEQLATTAAGFVGLLGPRARRDRLLDELGDRGEALRTRLRGPVGLDLGGSGPEAIALSILAELQQYLSATRFPGT